MVGGRLYDAKTMNEIGNTTSERRPFFFELEGGDTIHAATETWLDTWNATHGCAHP